MARKFEFVYDGEKSATTVSYRGQVIGAIHGNGDSGRYCFTLDCDRSRKPQLYRGRLRAAEALLMIHKIVEDWNRRSLSLRELVVNAWRTRPAITGSSNTAKTERSKRIKKPKSLRPARA